MSWTEASGLSLYDAQEEAILEVFADSHVILKTPTGSGKSLVALAAHFRDLGLGRRSFYTAPIKALVSEKFFDLCKALGPDHVGLMTGDASVNRDAPVICCTAEVLANLTLRLGEALEIATVVMDEFHFYGDRERGMAWQLPLLTLPSSAFLLMSATLGDTQDIEAQLKDLTGRDVAVVASDERPVPLEFTYSTEPLHDTIRKLVNAERAPIYLVNFTQRAAAETAQALTSVNLLNKEERRALLEHMRTFTFDSPYGKDMKRFIGHGVGLHHGGLIPKYRLLVERLAREGLLKVISGTDTLGVGVNVPIRSVVLTQLCKFDGEKARLLSVRDFRQITGRAGRKGFDDRGYVVGQAPAHVIENTIAVRKAEASGRKGKVVRKKPPTRGYVAWDEGVFNRLCSAPPEALEPRFEVDHGMVLSLLQRDPETLGYGGGYGELLRLIERCHHRDGKKQRLEEHANLCFEELVRAGLVSGDRTDAQVSDTLQTDFSLMHTLSLFLVGALETIDMASEGHEAIILSFTESILDSPKSILIQQERRIKDALIAQWKAEGVEYDERMTRLETISWPKPCAELLYALFNSFAEGHPWVRGEVLRPKSIARDLYERYMTFGEYVRELGLQRLEGVLLRYLNNVYKTLLTSVPESFKSEAVHDVEAFLRVTLERVDDSLAREWERLSAGDPSAEHEHRPLDISTDSKAFRARVRAELHQLLKTLADEEYEAAVRALRAQPDTPWTPESIEDRINAFKNDHGALRFDHAARMSDLLSIQELGSHQWRVGLTLLDEHGPTLWSIEGSIDLREDTNPSGPMIILQRLSP